MNVDQLAALLDRQRSAFRRDGVPAIDARRAALGRLRTVLIERTDDIVAAVAADFGPRSVRETRFFEIAAGVSAIDEAMHGIEEWAAPLEVATPPLLGTARSMVEFRPKGVVGIIVPWNYPIGL